MTTWNDVFQPVRDKSGNLEARPQQEILGDNIINALNSHGSVLLGNAPTGSGKSFATLVPAIDYIRRNKNKNKKVVFSVTTLALQDQIAKKDLPFLETIYRDFTWSVLKGRNRYLCKNRMKLLTAADPKLNDLFLQVDGIEFSTGEREELESRFRKLTDLEWFKMSGDSKYCSDSQCEGSRCYGARARDRAAGKDIVVVNHSVLIANQEMMNLGREGFLGTGGQFDVLIVDEAHELENSMISFLEEKVTEYEIKQWQETVLTGIQDAMTRGLLRINEKTIVDSLSDIQYVHSFLVDYYHSLSLFNQEEWKNSTTKITKKSISVTAPQELKNKKKRFAEEIVDTLYSSLKNVNKVYVDLEKSIKRAQNLEETKLGKMIKAKNKLRDLYVVMVKVYEACDTSQGYAMDHGVPYGVLMNGYYNKNDEVKGSIIVTPLEVSKYCEVLFANKTCIFVSATLKDLSSNPGREFEYFIKSMGLGNREVTQLDLEAVFDYSAQQLVYLTGSEYSIESSRVRGVRYSLKELESLIKTAKGRTLVLFTSNAELEEALQYLTNINIPYPLYAQGGSLSKQELVDKFMGEESSILLGSKSFFTGVDFHGEACSLVVLVKFPNPRFDDLCRLRVDWWAKKGYRSWYEREALNVFQQGAGRLIRKGDDRGVVAILDKRAVNPKEKVHASVGKGVTAMGSPITRNVNDVDMFLKGQL